MASGVFGLKKVYKRQVENINNGNFASWTESVTQGYIMAGTAPGPNNRSSIVRYNYTEDVSAILPPSSTVPSGSGLTNAVAVFSNNYGYYAGGANPTSNTISRFDFTTELSSLPGNNLSTIVQNLGGLSRTSEGYGYFIGGNIPTATPKQSCTVTRLDFTTETLSPMPNLTTSTEGIKGFNGTTYAYALGGGTGAATSFNTIYRLDFSNNTLAISLPGKNLKTARSQFVVNETPLYGYASAGTPNISSIERLDFSTENITTLSTANASSNTGTGTGFSSLFGGYMMGVTAGSLDRLEFSNETILTTIPCADFRTDASTVNAIKKQYNKTIGTYAYVNQGSGTNAVDKISYQTETWSANVITNSSAKQGLTGGASSNTYGYIFAGKQGTGQTSAITRIDFSNDSYTSGGKDKNKTTFYMPSSVISLQDAGVTQSNSYAYYAGGSNGVSSQVWRMDFTTEDFVLLTSGLSGKVFVTVKSATTGYLNNGTDSKSTVYRLNFSNETISSSLTYPINLNSQLDGCAYNQQYGYFLGGSTPLNNKISYVYRIDFANDVFALIPTQTPAVKNGSGTGSSSGDLSAFIQVLQDSGNSSVHRLSFSTETLTQLSPSPASRTDCVAITNANT